MSDAWVSIKKNKRWKGKSDPLWPLFTSGNFCANMIALRRPAGPPPQMTASADSVVWMSGNGEAVSVETTADPEKTLLLEGEALSRRTDEEANPDDGLRKAWQCPAIPTKRMTCFIILRWTTRDWDDLLSIHCYGNDNEVNGIPRSRDNIPSWTYWYVIPAEAIAFIRSTLIYIMVDRFVGLSN